MADLIGQSLGQYHILEQLGQGGMATVYKAYDTRLERDVAVKVIRRAAFSPKVVDRMLKRFEREGKALAKLTHANIVPIIDYGEHQGSPYLVMPLIVGGSLKAVLEARQRAGAGPLAAGEAARLLAPIARALDYAHRREVLHRDVKPSNILLTEDGDPLLTDFGVAKILESEEGTTLTGAGMGVGTPEYMPPEQWLGKASAASDQYALGVVFYELVTGRKPYTADTPPAVMLKHVNDPLPRPRDLAPSLPEAAERLIFKAMAKDPAQRYPGMAELAQALEGIAAGPRALPAAPVVKSEPPAVSGKPVEPPAEQQVTRDDLAAGGGTPQREAPRAAAKLPAWLGWGLGGLVLAALATWLAAGAIISAVERGQARATSTPAFTPTPEYQAGETRTRSADGMVEVYVPAGVFSMGSNDGHSDERPVHKVYLDGFWIDRTEVTNGMYAKCVSAGACTAPSSRKSYTRGSYYGNSAYEDYPVIFVDWHQANAYCAWAGARLPSEAEWEKAARGEDGRAYPWGDGSPSCSLANYSGCKGDTTEAGSLPDGASPYGALDLAGNVWEWVADWYDRDYYSSQTEWRNPAGPSSGSRRVLRGGSWDDHGNILRASSRSRYAPVFTSYDGLGFRCARW